MVMHAATTEPGWARTITERRRALARVLHEAPRVDPRFANLHVSILLYRERAAQMFKKLVDLEAAGNDNVAPLRRALVDAAAKIEAIASVVGAPLAREAWDVDWIDEPTLPRPRERG